MDRLEDKTSFNLFLSGAASVLVSRDHDNETRDHWVNHQQMAAEVSQYGDHMISYGGNLLLAGAQFWLDHENGESHLRALVYTGLSTVTLKGAFGRERPNQANHQSFPSGHTSSAFATATSMTYAYGWKAGVVLYPLAIFVGASRIADDDHWFSDVVGGAFLGALMARATFYSGQSAGTKHPEGQVTSARVSIVPWFQRDVAGLQLVWM